MIGAIILAAGDSRRMGTPKALLRIGKLSFLERVCQAAREAGLEPRVVVLGAAADKILSLLDLHEATVVRNREMSAGPIGSIRAGIRELAVNQEVEAVVVWHVDRPHVEPGTVAALAKEFMKGAAQIVLPEYEGRRGHPVLFGRAVFAELLAAPDATGARAVVQASPARVAVVSVADPAVLEDIDTPDDYRDLLSQGYR